MPREAETTARFSALNSDKSKSKETHKWVIKIPFRGRKKSDTSAIILSTKSLFKHPVSPQFTAMKCLIESSNHKTAKQLESIAVQCAIDSRTQIETKRVVRSKIQSNFITLQIDVSEALGDSQSWCLACRLSCFCPSTRISIIISAQPLFKHTAPQMLHQKTDTNKAVCF